MADVKVVSPPSAYSGLLDAIEQPMAIIDQNAIIRVANTAFNKLFVHGQQNVVGKEVGELASDGQRDALRDIFKRVSPDQLDADGRLEAQQGDGTMFHMQAHVRHLSDHEYLLSISKVDEPGLEYFSAELFQHAVESANDAIIITTPQLDEPHPQMLYVNPAFSRMTGYAYEEARGKTPRILHGPHTDRGLMVRLRHDLKETGFFHGETVNYRKDGSEYVVEWRISPLRGPSGETTHWVAVQREVTERVRQQQEIRSLIERLEQRVRERTDELEATNRELETFNYSVSHDLRAPLRTILGFGSALNEDYGDQIGADGRDYIDRMNRAARRMDDLITAILSLSRLSRAKMTRDSVDLSEIARAVGKEHEKAFPNVVLQIESGIVANADPSLARAVIGNLLENAFKFSHRKEGPMVQISSEQRGSRRYLRVSDNGIGFDQKYAARIFESFERLHTEKEYPGTGIGLATVLRAVRRHGGEVIAEGRPEEGATFLVWFGEPENLGP